MDSASASLPTMAFSSLPLAFFRPAAAACQTQLTIRTMSGGWLRCLKTLPSCVAHTLSLLNKSLLLTFLRTHRDRRASGLCNVYASALLLESWCMRADRASAQDGGVGGRKTASRASSLRHGRACVFGS